MKVFLHIVINIVLFISFYLSYTHRIRALIKSLGFTQDNFGKEIGVTRVTISNWLTNKVEVSPIHILKILDTFPNISCEWLIRGTGEMFINPNSSLFNEPEVKYESHKKHLEEKIKLLTELTKQKDTNIDLLKKMIERR